MQKFSLSRSVFGMWMRRYWPGAALLGAVFALVALAMHGYMRIGALTNYSAIHSAPFIAETALSIPLAFFFAFASIVASMLCFGYLKKIRPSVMLHSLPMRRETLFLSVSAAGLTLLMLPVMFGGLLFTLVQVVHNQAMPGAVAHWVLVMLAVCLFFFGASSFVGMLTGSTIAQGVFTLVFVNLPIMLEALVVSCSSRFLFGYTSSEPKTAIVNPFYLLGEYLANVYGDYISPGSSSGAFYPVALAAAGLVFLVLAILLYRVRRIEAAGDIIAMRGVRPVFQIGLALAAAVAGSAIARAVILTAPALALDLIFGGLGGLLGYFISEMFVRRSVRVLKTGWKGALCFVAAFSILISALSFDLPGYGQRQLQEDNVDYIAIGYYSNYVDFAFDSDNAWSGGALTDLPLTDVNGYLLRARAGDTSRMPRAIQKQILQLDHTVHGPGDMAEAIALQNAIAQNADLLLNTARNSWQQYGNGRSSYSIPVRAMLKNGQVFQRTYHFSLYSGQLPELQEQIRAFENDNEIGKLQNTLDFGRRADSAVLQFHYNLDFSAIALRRAEWRQLCDALGEDLAAQRQALADDPASYQRNDDTFLECHFDLPGEDASGTLIIRRKDTQAIQWLLENGHITPRTLRLFDYYMDSD